MEFPLDDAARENGFEFMWGAAMLIVPVLQPVRSAMRLIRRFFRFKELLK